MADSGGARRSTAQALVRLGWPVLVAQLATMANGVIDTVMAGHHSARALAVVGLGTSIYFSIFVSLMGVLLALTPTIAQHFGAGRHAEITHDVRQGLWLALAIALPGMALLGAPGPFIAFSGMAPSTAAEVREYLAALVLAAPAMLLFRVFYGWATAISEPRAVMVIQLVGLALKVPLNWVLMYGKLGLPALGGVGCAWALVIEAWLMLAGALAWAHFHPAFRRYRVFARIERPDLRAIGRLLRLGLPIGMAFLIDVTSYTFMALFIARLGETWSAGHQIAANLGALCYMIPLALANATAVLVGQSIGAGDFARARASGWTGLVIGLAIALVVAAAVAIAAAPIARLYAADPSVARLAGSLLGLVALFHVFDAVNAIAANALRGYKKTIVPMLAFAVGLWGIGLGGGYLAAFTGAFGPALGAPGMWMGAIAGMAVAAGAVTAYFARVSRGALARAPRHGAAPGPGHA
ncbi:MAG: MATE family efflux transporter [Burkholderiales bacterium]|nr:MATE family efflux transporter [Burkholderiales bacterium]